MPHAANGTPASPDLLRPAEPSPRTPPGLEVYFNLSLATRGPQPAHAHLVNADLTVLELAGAARLVSSVALGEAPQCVFALPSAAVNPVRFDAAS